MSRFQKRYKRKSDLIAAACKQAIKNADEADAKMVEDIEKERKRLRLVEDMWRAENEVCKDKPV